MCIVWYGAHGFCILLALLRLITIFSLIPIDFSECKLRYFTALVRGNKLIRWQLQHGWIFVLLLFLNDAPLLHIQSMDFCGLLIISRCVVVVVIWNINFAPIWIIQRGREGKRIIPRWGRNCPQLKTNKRDYRNYFHFNSQPECCLFAFWWREKLATIIQLVDSTGQTQHSSQQLWGMGEALTQPHAITWNL